MRKRSSKELGTRVRGLEVEGKTEKKEVQFPSLETKDVGGGGGAPDSTSTRSPKKRVGVLQTSGPIQTQDQAASPTDANKTIAIGKCESAEVRSK